MNMLLWALQLLASLLYVSSGIMKVFLFDKISHDVASFDALPRNAWTLLGILELVCAAGLVLPAALHRMTSLTVASAALLAIESLVFVRVHVKYREIAPAILSCVLGILMAFLAYDRMVLHPIL